MLFVSLIIGNANFTLDIVFSQLYNGEDTFLIILNRTNVGIVFDRLVEEGNG